MADKIKYEVRLARDDLDLSAAQRLRYDVFVTELGASGPLVDHDAGMERDSFDPHCDHLVLVNPAIDPQTLRHVKGVYRLLPGDRIEQTGGFYSEQEYDLTALKSSGRQLLELGRSCLHPDLRGGAGLLQLWAALADYVIASDAEILFGTASFHGVDVEALAEPLSYLYQSHLAPANIRARVLDEFYQSMDLWPQGDVTRASAMKKVPSLIKAYLRLGGKVGDGAYVDHAFNTTDVLLMLDTKNMTQRPRNIYERGKSV